MRVLKALSSTPSGEPQHLRTTRPLGLVVLDAILRNTTQVIDCIDLLHIPPERYGKVCYTSLDASSSRWSAGSGADFGRIEAADPSPFRPPGLAVVLVGHDPASGQYVRNKVKACAELGIYSEKLTPPGVRPLKSFWRLWIRSTAVRRSTRFWCRCRCQSMWIRGGCWKRSHRTRTPTGFIPSTSGTWWRDVPRRAPALRPGFIELLKYYRIPIDGRKAVVVGRSDIVGKPMALMLLAENATVTICHSRTANLPQECRARGHSGGGDRETGAGHGRFYRARSDGHRRRHQPHHRRRRRRNAWAKPTTSPAMARRG